MHNYLFKLRCTVLHTFSTYGSITTSNFVYHIPRQNNMKVFGPVSQVFLVPIGSYGVLNV